MPDVQDCGIFPTDGTPGAGKAAPVLLEKDIGLVKKEGLAAKLRVVKIGELEDATFHELQRGSLDQPVVVVQCTGDDLSSEAARVGKFCHCVHHFGVTGAPAENVGLGIQHRLNYRPNILDRKS